MPDNAPKCPRCDAVMVWIDQDMESQGGPPAETWFCSAAGCGATLASRDALEDVHVPDPPDVVLEDPAATARRRAELRELKHGRLVVPATVERPADRWYGFDCLNCGAVMDVRMREGAEERLNWTRCPDPECGSMMILKGTWPPHRGGYGSRGDQPTQREALLYAVAGRCELAAGDEWVLVGANLESAGGYVPAFRVYFSPEGDFKNIEFARALDVSLKKTTK